jgi:hypothetical protein
MRKAVFLFTVFMAGFFVFSAVVQMTPPSVKASGLYQVFLPLVIKAFPAPDCNVQAIGGAEQSNHVGFGINCSNVPTGWAHMVFDTTGHDFAIADVYLTEGIGTTNHDYPWPSTSFNARLTVTGLDGNQYDFNIPVGVVWP